MKKEEKDEKREEEEGRRKEGRKGKRRSITDIQILIIRSFGFSVGHTNFQNKLPISTTVPF